MLRYLVDPIFQVINTAGKPATGGYVEVYLHGTRDKYYCASDFEGTLHPFKIPLDSLGASIILADDANAYDIYVYNRYGSLLMSRYNVFPVQVGVFPYDLKTLTLKNGNRVLGTYSPLEQKSIDVSEIVFLDEQNPNLYQVITQSLLSDMVPVLTKSNLDPTVPGGVRRDYYYYPTSRTGVDGDYSFIGYDGQRSEIATVHDDDSVTYTTIEVPTASTASPSMDGTASAGSSTQWSRGDHVHPTDTSREAAANKTTTVRQNGQADNTRFPTEAAVRTAIDSAVSSAYHAAGTKTVAQLTGSLLVSANEGDVYNITDTGVTTSDFIEGAGLPIRVGDNVVVCDVGGGVYKFDLLSGFVDLTSYLTKTGDGSDVTASFTVASARTNVTTGEKMSVLFGKIAKWFSDLKALAFKDKVDTADIENDAVTADKVKDNETLPVNVTGYASHLRQAKCKFLDSDTGYRLMAELPPSINNFADTCYIFNIYETRDQAELTSGILKGVLSIRIRRDRSLYRYSSAYKGSALEWIGFDLRIDPNTHGINLYATKSGQTYAFTVFELLNGYDQYGAALNPTLHVESELLGSVSGTVVTPTFTQLKGSGGTIPLANNNGVGSVTQPVYVDSNGAVQPCVNRIHDLICQLKQITISGSTSMRYILCNRQNYTIENGVYVFQPVDIFVLATWINRGDVIQIDGAVATDPWEDRYPMKITEIQCSIDSGTNERYCSNIRVRGYPYSQTELERWSDVIEDETTHIRYMEFQTWS